MVEKKSQVTDVAPSENDQQQVKQKCRRFLDWFYANGGVCSKLDYPAFFDGGLVGVKANAQIKHQEAYLFIP